jgi:substrate import-associated zinc metallohydrolase lipoprotein
MNTVIKQMALICITGLFLTACTPEEEFGKSIFDVNIQDNPTSASYHFDQWLKEAYLKPYNLDFRYKLQDVASDLDYNLVPTQFDKSVQMAKLVKYLWFDVYSAVAGPDFLKENGPRIIHLIGSPAYNPISGTMLLGTAEGGIKVTLYRCNDIDPYDIDLMNEFYFRTMHHEFAHILHQKRNYPLEFGLISKGKYNPLGWQYKTDSEAATLGFVTPYAGSQNREDFVEVIANFLIKSDQQWNDLLKLASLPGVDIYGNTLPDDGLDGKAIILQKLAIVRKWLKDSWNIDLDSLRSEIITRQATIDQVII